MRYNLPKRDFIEAIIEESKEYFAVNNIDVSKVGTAVYNDIFCSMVVNALDFFIEWRFLNEDEISKTLSWIYASKRQRKNEMTFYSYLEAEDHLTLALARLRIIVENKLTISLNEQDREQYLNELMNKYYFYVLDDIDLQLKSFLTNIIGKSTWDVFDVVHYKRNIELVNYGDFRILTWDMNRKK